MKTSKYTTTVLTASDGHKLTEAAGVDILSRTVTPRVFLAATDAPANWREITDAEADSIRARQEAAMKAEEDAAASIHPLPGRES